MSSNTFFDICCGLEEEETKPGGFVTSSSDGDTGTDWLERDSSYVSSRASLSGSLHHAREKAEVALELKRGKEVCSQPLHVSDSFQYIPTVFEKSKEDEEFLRRTLKSFILFQELSDEEIQTMIDATERQEISKRTTLVKQDKNDQYLQIIQKGKVDVYCERSQQSVGTLKSGDIFGEMALLYGEDAPNSFIVADDSTVVWRIDHHTFRHILAHSAHKRDSNIRSRLSNIPLFQSFSEQNLQKFANSLTRVAFQNGESIVTKGDEGSVFYLIEDGEVKVHDIGIGDGKAVDQFLSAGDCFGERALLTGEPRAANVTAQSNVVTLLAMDREDFERYMGDLQEIMDFDGKLRSLKSLAILADSDLTPIEFQRLAEQTIEVCYRKETKLVEAGKKNESNLWIIRTGRLLVYGGKSGKVYNLQSGDCFGERDLLRHSDEILTHDAICEGNLTTWVLSRESLESVVVDLNRLGQDARFVKRKSQKPITRQDLKKHRILGEGAFGKVWLTENVVTQAPYALKVVNKRIVLASKQEQSVMRERELLALLYHPFILDMVASFQDATNLYMLLPLIQGGELFSQVASRSQGGIGLPSKEAAFYTGCVVEALGHFHHRYIAYRDLKLENVMIDGEGYAKIVDLGFAKVVMGKTYTFCGTPEYLAPEVIMSKGHNHAVDYWSLGVFMYTLLTGVSPFYDSKSSQMDMFKRIVLVHYKLPSTIDILAGDLIQKLLVRNMPDRLGNLKRGHYDIHDHSWFINNGCHYKKLLKKEVSAPWIPQFKDPFDMSNFDNYGHSVSEHGYPLSPEEQKLFNGF